MATVGILTQPRRARRGRPRPCGPAFAALHWRQLVPAILAFCAFNLLCAPCFAAIGTIRRQMSRAKWTWFAIGYMTRLRVVRGPDDLPVRRPCLPARSASACGRSWLSWCWPACCSSCSAPCRGTAVRARGRTRLEAGRALHRSRKESAERVAPDAACARRSRNALGRGCARMFHVKHSVRKNDAPESGAEGEGRLVLLFGDHARQPSSSRLVVAGARRASPCAAWCAAAPATATTTEEAPAHGGCARQEAAPAAPGAPGAEPQMPWSPTWSALPQAGKRSVSREALGGRGPGRGRKRDPQYGGIVNAKQTFDQHPLTSHVS